MYLCITIQFCIHIKACTSTVGNSHIRKSAQCRSFCDGYLIHVEDIVLLQEVRCKSNILTLAFIVSERNSKAIESLRVRSIYCIYRNESREVGRVCHHTDNQTRHIVSTYRLVASSPESNLQSRYRRNIHLWSSCIYIVTSWDSSSQIVCTCKYQTRRLAIRIVCPVALGSSLVDEWRECHATIIFHDASTVRPIIYVGNDSLYIVFVECLNIWYIRKVLGAECISNYLRLCTTTVSLDIEIILGITLESISTPLVIIHILIFYYIGKIFWICLRASSQYYAEAISIQRAIPTQNSRVRCQTIYRDVAWVVASRHRTNDNLIQSDTTTVVIYTLKSKLIGSRRSRKCDSVVLPSFGFVLKLANLHPSCIRRGTIVDIQRVHITRMLHLCMRENHDWLERLCQINDRSHQFGSEALCLSGGVAQCHQTTSLKCLRRVFGRARLLHSPRYLCTRRILLRPSRWHAFFKSLM